MAKGTVSYIRSKKPKLSPDQKDSAREKAANKSGPSPKTAIASKKPSVGTQGGKRDSGSRATYGVKDTTSMSDRAANVKRRAGNAAGAASNAASKAKSKIKGLFK